MRLIGSIAVATVVSCGGAEGNPWIPELLDGAHVVFEGRRWDSYNVLSTNLEYLAIQDVHHDARGWFLTLRGRWTGVATFHPVMGCDDCMADLGSAGAKLDSYILESADGARWAPLVPEGEWAGGVPRGLWRPPSLPSDLLVIGEAGHTGVGGDWYKTWNVTRIDLAANAFVRDSRYDQEAIFDPHVAGGTLGGVWRDSLDATLAATVDAEGVRAWTLSMAAAGYDIRHLWPAVGVPFRSADGERWEGYTPILPRPQGAGGWRDELCKVTIRQHHGGELPQISCVGAATLPPAFYGSGAAMMTHVSGLGVVRIVSDTNAYALRIEDGATEPIVVALGPGSIFGGSRVSAANMWQNDLRQRYDWLVRLDLPEGQGSRFVGIGADGSVYEHRFPKSPCKNDCLPELQWIEPLPDGRWIAFWIIQDQSAALQELIVAMEVDGRWDEIDTPDPNDGTSPLPAFPNAIPAGGIERACLAMRSCHPGLRDDTCIGFWQTIRGTGVERFVEAADAGCAALDEAWGVPATLGRACPPAQGSWCVGNVAVTDCAGGTSGIVTRAYDCGVVGTTCTSEGLGSAQARCVDGSVAADDLVCGTCTPAGNVVQCSSLTDYEAMVVACDARSTCAAGSFVAECVPPGECVDGVTTPCESDTYATCYQGRRTEVDCTLWADRCYDWENGGSCDRPGDEYGCSTQQFRQGCVGSVAAWCVPGNEVHYVDCTELGFSGCNDANGIVTCLP